MRRSSRSRFAIGIATALWSIGCGGPSERVPNDAIVGRVIAAGAPIAGARVRVQGTTHAATTDADGRFVIAGLAPRRAVPLSAWAPGYFIGGGEDHLPGSEITISLTSFTSEDNADYLMVPARGADAAAGHCQACHSDPSDPRSALPFDEWLRDAHGRSAENPRFLTMYAGTDVAGNQSPETRYVHSRDYAEFPLPPDPSKPYYGPGYRLDFPRTAGNCGACHLPAAAIDDAYGVDARALSGIGAEGVACDFCHKVWDVTLDRTTGRPVPNMPGVASFSYRRPPAGHQFFAGPFDDVAPGEDTYLPLYRESAYCAPCHIGTFWGTTIYNSYGEWLDSPYSDPVTGKTCQACHMPRGLTDRFVRRAAGGRVRDPLTIASHRMLGVTDPELMRSALTMEAAAERTGAQVAVTVTLSNDNTGHHVPTDSPLRQVLLVVRAVDAQGAALAQTGGPTLPSWTGTGDPAAGAYGGLPGQAYARILEELWTGTTPTGAYWNQVRVVSDNRLAAFARDTTTYRFDAAGAAAVRVTVTLRFRRAFFTLVAQKGWDLDDLTMAEQQLDL